MHSNISIGDHVIVHIPGAERRIRVEFVADSYFTAGGVRYRKVNGFSLWGTQPDAIATPDESRNET